MAITENPRTGDFILSMANGTLSLENAILESGENLKAGTVLGAGTSSKFVQLDPASETAGTAIGVLFDNVDASDADQTCVVLRRQAEVKADGLIWPAGISTNDKAAAIQSLNSLGVFVR